MNGRAAPRILETLAGSLALLALAAGCAAPPPAFAPARPIRAAADGPGGPTATATTLYERLGGARGVEAIIADLGRRNAVDPITAPRLAGANRARIRQGLIELLSHLAGGPDVYRGAPLAPAHAGMKISDAEFDAFMKNLAASLEERRVAERDRAEVLAGFDRMRGDVVAHAPGPDERFDRLDTEIVGLERRLSDIERRLDAILARLDAGARVGPLTAAPQPPVPAPPPPFSEDEKKLVPSLLARYKSEANTASGGDARDDLIGRPLPETRFLGPTGAPFDLRQYEGKKKVVLIMLRGFSGTVCIHCSAQTLALADAAEEFRKRNAELVLVYPGKSDSVPGFVGAVRGLRQGFDPPFPIVLDADCLLVRTFRIEGNLAKPASFVIDEKRIVRYAYVGRQPADRPSAKELLEAIDRIGR